MLHPDTEKQIDNAVDSRFDPELQAILARSEAVAADLKLRLGLPSRQQIVTPPFDTDAVEGEFIDETYEEEVA